jgi:protein-L-isoaspartate O-methyltransferase
MAMTRAAELAEGALPPGSPWDEVFAAVPRRAFLPHAYLWSGAGWRQVSTDSAPGRERLRRLAATDVTVVVQLGAAGQPVASCLQPSMAARILDAAELEDQHRVLELGTGTGYLTALLCERLSSAQVVTVEIDPELAALAAELLDAWGCRPHLIAADGTAGYPGQVPYDRVVASYAVGWIPSAWIHQTRPGGVLVVPVHSGIAQLVVSGEGAASGRFLPQPAYILPSRAPATAPAAAAPAAGPARTTKLPSRVVFDDDFRFFLDLAAPGLGLPDGRDPAGVELHADDGSWARVGLEGVQEAGPRRVWAEVERAHAEWCELGQPGRDRFRLTVAGGSQTVGLTTAAGERSWPLASNPALLATGQ